jgi:hypothetical protein
MGLSPSWEAASHSRISQYCMESEGTLPCSQESSTGPCPEPDQSTPYHPILSLQDLILAYFAYLKKIKVGLCDLHAVCVCESPPLTFECLNESL